MYRSIALILSIVVFAVLPRVVQPQNTDLPKVVPSSLIADLVTLSGKKPGVGLAAIVKFANEKLSTDGYEFEVDPCDIGSMVTPEKYPGENGGVYSIYTAITRSGKEQKFLADEPHAAPCGCWLNLPIKSATPKRLVINSETGSFELVVPKELLLEEVDLVDRSLRKSVRTWIVPSGGPPDGISMDGKKLYFRIEEQPLLLEISETGNLRIIPRNDKTVIAKFVDLKKFPTDPKNDYLGYRSFSNGKQKFTLKFSHVCT